MKEYAATFCFFLSLFALSNCGFDTSEGTVHYQFAEQLLRSGSLSFPEDQLPDKLHRTDPVTIGPDGRVYASHEIGNTVFYLPTASLNLGLGRALAGRPDAETVERAKEFVMSFQAGLYSALALGAFCLVLRRLSVPPGYRFLATAALALTTYFWTYTRSSFDGVLCSTLIVHSLLALMTHGQSKSTAALVAAFVLLGLAVITRLTAAFAVAASVAYLVVMGRGEMRAVARRLTAASLTLAPFIAWQAWYNWVRTGNALTSPMNSGQYADNALTLAGAPTHLFGLLFSPGKGIFVYAPLLLVSLVCYPRFLRGHAAEATYVLALLVPWLVLHSMMKGVWHGGWGFGPRHFVTVLPLAFLPFAAEVQWVFSRRWLRTASYALALAGFVLALSSIISEWHFRMRYADARGLLENNQHDFVWGLTTNQAVDMVRGAAENVLRAAGLAPPLTLERGHQVNMVGSTTLNLWPYVLVRRGYMSVTTALIAVAVLILAACVAARILYRL